MISRHKWRVAKGMKIGKIPTFFHDARFVRLPAIVREFATPISGVAIHLQG